MNVAENFLAFRNAYVIDQDQMDSISYRYRRITRQLNSDFWNTESETSHSLYIGSYGRDTAIKGVSDVDIDFRLPSNIYETYKLYRVNGQSALLQAVRSSMQKTYPLTALKGDGQVVSVQDLWSDGTGALRGAVNRPPSILSFSLTGGS
jgi:hypothetical protein